MKKILIFALIAILLTGASCRKDDGLTFLSVRVTEFGIKQSGKSLQFPLTIGVIDSAQAVRDIEEAEYFYHKLSSIYDFKRFSYLSSTTVDTALRGSLKASEPFTVFSSSGPEGNLRLTLESITGADAIFRLTRIGADTVNYPITAQSGRSVSVGVTNSSDSTRGTLLIVTAWILSAPGSADTTEVMKFLAEKNRVRSGVETTAPVYYASDQRLLDRYLGKDAVKLPITVESDGALGNEGELFNADSLDEHPFSVENLPKLFGKLIYPEQAMKDRVQGTVVLKFLVDSTGSVKKMKVIRGVRPDVDSAATTIFNGVTFHPPRAKGVGVSVWLTLPVRFALREEPSK